jgi:hypothetical protein
MAASEAIEVVYRLKDPKPKYTDLTDKSCLEYMHHQRNSDFVMNVRKRVGFTNVGLCLDCIRSGGQHKTHSKAVQPDSWHKVFCI